MIQRTRLNQASESYSSQGFTLVELTIATAFIAFILIFMLAAIVQVIGNYNKGLAVKQINQTARTIVEEMGRLAQATSASTINTAYINNGRVCLGGVSYVWNIKGADTNKDTTGAVVGMVRVNDPAGSLCAAALPTVNAANASELLSGQVWVQQVGVTVSGNQKLVDIAIGLSTSAPNNPTGTDPILGEVCEGGRDSQYCAVATFRTTVTTKDGGGY